MNIAIFASAFHPSLGGVEELVRQLAHAYRKRGHTPIILTNRWPRSLPAYEEYEGLALYRPAMRLPEPGFKARLTYRVTHAAISRQINNILRERAVDLLHVQCVGPNGYYALQAKRALGLPLVVTAQGELTMDADHLYQRPSFMNHLLPTLLDEADAVTGCSQKTLSDVEAHVGGSFGAKGRVIHNGANLADFERGETFVHSKPYLLGIGRLAPQKGFDVLLRAFARADLDSHDLILAGDGPEKATLAALAGELKLGNRVILAGRADRNQAVALFKGCSFFVLPSRADEGLPLVGVEAMAAGKAIIATPTGGILEAMTEGESGLIVPKEDIDALAEAMRRLSADAVLRQRLGAAAKQRATAFDWPAIADKYLDLYREVLQ